MENPGQFSMQINRHAGHSVTAHLLDGEKWSGAAVAVDLSERADGVLSDHVAALWVRYYPDFRIHAFRHMIESRISPSMQVLDLGAGSGLGIQAAFSIKGRCARYVGVDLDPRVLANPHLDEAHIADASALPFPDASFDLVFHKMVAEHLADPVTAFQEIARVLKPGGVMLCETPNRFYYPMLLAAVTPTWFHSLLIRKLGSTRAAADVFPTFYRVNDRRAVDRVCRAAGLQANVELRSNPPGYLRGNAALFRLGVLYERVVERLFPDLRAVMWIEAHKKPALTADDGRQNRTPV